MRHTAKSHGLELKPGAVKDASPAELEVAVVFQPLASASKGKVTVMRKVTVGSAEGPKET